MKLEVVKSNRRSDGLKSRGEQLGLSIECQALLRLYAVQRLQKLALPSPVPTVNTAQRFTSVI